jgi:hypothetical protein
MVRLDGKKSQLRKTMLEQACTEVNIEYRKPLHPGTTRFGSHEKTGQRCVYLKDAIVKIINFPTSEEEDESRKSWADLKLDLNNAYPILEHILPIFKEVEQWTQILSSKNNPTLCKCRLACRRLKQIISNLELTIENMQDGRIKLDLENALSGLKAAQPHHMGHDYYNFPAIRVAEFLDVEVFNTIPVDEWDELRGDGTIENPGLIANFLFEVDTISPAEMKRREVASNVAVVPRRRSRVATVSDPQPVPEPTPQEAALARLNNNIVLSEVNPLLEECKNYINLVVNLVDDLNTLGFWRMYAHKFPILSRVARRLLCCSATSCDVERLFSRAGLICSTLRNRLAPKTIQCLTTLHYFYADEEKRMKEETSREKAATGRAKHFATLTSDLIIKAADSYISDSDSDVGDF